MNCLCLCLRVCARACACVRAHAATSPLKFEQETRALPVGPISLPSKQCAPHHTGLLLCLAGWRASQCGAWLARRRRALVGPGTLGLSVRARRPLSGSQATQGRAGRAAFNTNSSPLARGKPRRAPGQLPSPRLLFSQRCSRLYPTEHAVLQWPRACACAVHTSARSSAPRTSALAPVCLGSPCVPGSSSCASAAPLPN